MTLGLTTSLAFSALLRNRMRSMLTILGVVIGVAAVLMMESLGQGATAYISDTISGMGSNILMVVPGSPHRAMGPSTSGAPLFTQADVEALRRVAHAAKLVAPIASRPLRTVYGANNRSVSVSGVGVAYLEIRGWGVDGGRTLTHDDERQGAQVCLVGHTVVTALTPSRT